MYRPTFAADGSYTLTVQASDISRNQSGDNDYKVRFEVINKPTITEVLNYPNPFTTSTRFVFTVTGQQPPTYMKIQIMTVSGRVVREVGMEELGPIRVGRNITEFAWDGTDEYGDKLARGVYLYRVVAKLNGEDIEYRSTSAEGFFEKGIGKMYLLR
jgi:flagellar hook assembly protein FlgD